MIYSCRTLSRFDTLAERRRLVATTAARDHATCTPVPHALPKSRPVPISEHEPDARVILSILTSSVPAVKGWIMVRMTVTRASLAQSHWKMKCMALLAAAADSGSEDESEEDVVDQWGGWNRCGLAVGYGPYRSNDPSVDMRAQLKVQASSALGKSVQTAA